MEGTRQLLLCIALVSSSYAVCPSNPRKKAAECGKFFTEFGNATPDVQRHLCPGVYQAVDCIFNLMTECDEFKDAGDPNDFREGMLSTLHKVCPQYVIQEPRCNVKDFAQMINQCSELALVDYKKRRDVCRYIIRKSNCMENVFEQCQDVVEANSRKLSTYEKDLESYRDTCKRGKTPVMTIKVEDGYVNDGTGKGLTDTQSITDQKNYQECTNLANKCAVISLESNRPQCPVMKDMFECMDQVMASCGNLVPPSVREQVQSSRQEYFRMCLQKGNAEKNATTNTAVTEGENANIQTVAGETEIDLLKEMPSRDKITKTECNHLIKLCSDMIVDMYRPDEEQCKKNERIRHCLMSTIHMCLFVLPPELVANLRISTEQYKLCQVDKCPYPDRDFDQCENIMDGVREAGLCKAGYITLECYKVLRARCDNKLTGYQKGSVRDFEAYMRRKC